MRLIRLLSAIAVLVTVGAGLLLSSARGQDEPGRDEQIQRIRQLPADEKRRLKEALDRFNALPQAEREALRAKARAVGVDRLGELAGRDFAKLRQKHAFLQRETEEVMRFLGGPERLASLSPEERAYVRDQVMRGFQRFCGLRLLEAAGLDARFDQLSPAEKRDRRDKAMAAVVQKILEEKPLEEQARYRALPPAEQKRERWKMRIEWRLRQTTAFARTFENGRLVKILDMPAEERHRLLAGHVRWYQLINLLHTDGADRDTLKMLGQLGPDERAQIAQVYEQAQDLPSVDRRRRVTDKIREVYGASTFDAERMQRPFPRLPELLRERARHDRERRAAETPPAPK